MIYIKLSDEETNETILEGVFIHEQSCKKGHVDNVFNKYGNSLDTNISGAIGERVVRKLLGLPFKSSEGSYKNPDVLDYQIRTSIVHTNRPFFREHEFRDDTTGYVRKADNPKDTFIYVSLSDKKATDGSCVWGVYTGEEILSHKNVINPNGRGPMNVMEKKDLNLDFSTITGLYKHKPMKIIIAGSRSITDYNKLLIAIEYSNYNITEIVSGGAKGVDMLGEQFAKNFGIPVKRFIPNWRPNGELDKSAGFKRNKEMADYGEALIAVHDGQSKGTSNMINLARNKGIPVVVYNTTTGVFS
jgi:hypothetical protein